ncbi:MAG: FtsX-like permease family protein, partial [Sphingomonadales bacterium]
MQHRPRGLDATRWLLAGEWRAHPVRLGLAVLAIAVGVALGFAVHLVNSAALASFGRAVASVQGRADVAVRARSAAGLDEALYAKLARLPPVQAVSPVVEVPASWGRLARPGSESRGGRFTLIGIDPLRAMAVTPGLVGMAVTGQVGTRPSWRGDQIWMSPALMRSAGVGTGGVFTLTAAGRQAQFRVAGQLAGAGTEVQLAVIDIAEAQWRFGQLGRLQRLDLKLRDGAGARAAVAAALPADAMLATPEAEATRADALSRAYRVNLGMLALVALLTGGFLVWSAQALGAARRRPQFALLAVLGLPRAGLVRQLLIEGLALGVAGAALGVALGYGLAALVVARSGGDLGGGYFHGAQARLGFDAGAALLFGALGLATALAGSIGPALSAAQAAPAQALKGLGDVPDPARVPRAWPGAALLLAGAV